MKADETLESAILDFDEEAVLARIKSLKEGGWTPLGIMEVARNAMGKIGKMFEEKQIFLTELIMSGELLKSLMNELSLSADASSEEGKSKGKILLGTVKDDIHDIGKNILKSLLVSEGFDVVDIGVDVPIDDFVSAAKEHAPQVVALSGLLTVAYDSMKETVEAFEKAGIRDDFKVIVGGGSTDEKVKDHAGADDFGASAVDGMEKIKNWLQGAS